MNGDNGTSTQAPQMRALLFTDLCDSLILVERIGDAAAAELFQQHDRLVLTLQQQWNGRLIDRSDGLFLLFERAIDGLGFALEYQRELKRLSKQQNLELRARSGLHVGEVLTWENSAEAVKAGAKSLEVEGLAKPMAARLMMLARPGQILLSAVAESLTHRATSALGERAERLVWKSHGRWRFKGIPTTQEVYEVGEIGSAPLRTPRGSAKARRDIPLWRQPAALAAEALVLASLAVGGWLLLRPAPAIAFAERDWVVLGDVRNLTGEPLLDDSLDQAFRISLGQSKHVNVLSDIKVRETLAMMRQPGEAILDRRTAIEVAMRDGARAVIMPSVLEINGKLRVTVEVIDPANGNAVYSHSADGRGMESVLTSADQVVAALRDDLGEAMKDISRDSVPLPKVATSSIDALHAYAKGLAALYSQDFDSALMFFKQAAAVDPGFAFAYIGMMRIRHGQGDLEEALRLYDIAYGLRDRLTPRERLYLQAWGAQFGGAAMPAVAEQWRMMTELYPDDPAGHMNYSSALYGMGKYDAALVAARPLLLPQNPHRAFAQNYIGRIHLAVADAGQAQRMFKEAAALDQGASDVWLALSLAAAKDYEASEAIFAHRTLRGPGEQIERSSSLVDQGRFGEASALIERAKAECVDVADVCRVLDVIALHQQRLSGNPTPRTSYATILDVSLKKAEQQDAASRRESALFILATAYQTVRAGHSGTVRARAGVLKALTQKDDEPRARQLWALVQSALEIEVGQPQNALKLLEPFVNGDELYQVHVMLHDAYEALEDEAGQKQERDWLERQRGRAYAEELSSYVLQSLNLDDARRLQNSATQGAAVP
ncbi:putative peptide modification system cyclase [Stenotrophomonas rhizophila]|uniref:putative peptide modification system cyclase n=1 Tax=Stenotrophomonas rhizophila TaxID=216778 RepID=UPI001E5DE11A|nr:putative peptide modification system cyclase [Stenotrophomonas rhizophila]MCC7633122.1 putative peptide modification system cyclase [Stenotrophomonas rhizophila]MCC7662015.1 putative peptide modification system cyclase [Stenotrophomonas rhizophila]